MPCSWTIAIWFPSTPLSPFCVFAPSIGELSTPNRLRASKPSCVPSQSIAGTFTFLNPLTSLPLGLVRTFPAGLKPGPGDENSPVLTPSRNTGCPVKALTNLATRHSIHANTVLTILILYTTNSNQPDASPTREHLVVTQKFCALTP